MVNHGIAAAIKKAGLRAGRPGAVRKGVRGWLTALPFILPGLILVAVFVLYPLLFTIRIALSNYQIVQGNITFIGLENFKKVLSGGSRFWYAYRNNFLYALVTVPFILLGGMLFAYLINNLRRGQGVFRVGFYLPVITSWVIVSLVFQYMFNNSNRGLINYILVDALHVLKQVKGIAQCYFTEKDVVRHRLVQEIIKAYDGAAHPEKQPNQKGED